VKKEKTEVGRTRGKGNKSLVNPPGVVAEISQIPWGQPPQGGGVWRGGNWYTCQSTIKGEGCYSAPGEGNTKKEGKTSQTPEDGPSQGEKAWKKGEKGKRKKSRYYSSFLTPPRPVERRFKQKIGKSLVFTGYRRKKFPLTSCSKVQKGKVGAGKKRKNASNPSEYSDGPEKQAMPCAVES